MSGQVLIKLVAAIVYFFYEMYFKSYLDWKMEDIRRKKEDREGIRKVMEERERLLAERSRFRAD